MLLSWMFDIQLHRDLLDLKTETQVVVKRLFTLLTFANNNLVIDIVKFGTEKLLEFNDVNIGA